MESDLTEEPIKPISQDPDDPAVTVTGEKPPVRDRGRVIAAGVIGGLALLGIGLYAATSHRAPAPAQPSVALTTAAEVDAGKLETAIAIVVDAGEPAKPRPPPVWRVSSLKVDANDEVVEGTFGKKGFVQALTAAGLSRVEIKRVSHAFEGVHRVEHPAEKDSFVLAKDKAKGTVVAFEYMTSPVDVWQTKAEDGDRLVTRKLDLYIEHKHTGGAVVVTTDIAKAIQAAGLRADIVDAVDDALDGHIEAGSIQAGARMRIAATEDWVDGQFARIRVDGLEFVPKSGTPSRVYFYERDASVEGSARRAPAAGFYNAKAQQPYRGAFRSPLAIARVTSRFNPKRMHPVLKVLMPHNGVDFGATTGTPVFAAAAGTVLTAGNGGPCGNMVEIEHGGGITTVYCHLNGFASGLHAGQKVDARQLVGYVGHTGRVTGPHLHFGVKRGGVFIDPLTMKLDGVRVLPPIDREAFARKRVDIDAAIDGIALPSAVDVPDPPEETDDHAE